MEDQICKTCGAENPPLKKCCYNCGEILVGDCINNVTGECGYRDEKGVFHPNDK